MNNDAILSQLIWGKSTKDNCETNVRKAYWIEEGLGLPSDWAKYSDTQFPKLWNVWIISPWTSIFSPTSRYWQVWFVWTIIDINWTFISLYDWIDIIKCDINYINWFISAQKMKELGSTIEVTVYAEKWKKEQEDWFYEIIFKRKFPQGWIDKEIDISKKQLGDSVFYTNLMIESLRKEIKDELMIVIKEELKKIPTTEKVIDKKIDQVIETTILKTNTKK